MLAMPVLWMPIAIGSSLGPYGSGASRLIRHSLSDLPPKAGTREASAPPGVPRRLCGSPSAPNQRGLRIHCVSPQAASPRNKPGQRLPKSQAIVTMRLVVSPRADCETPAIRTSADLAAPSIGFARRDLSARRILDRLSGIPLV
jgi:hypothetical protein